MPDLEKRQKIPLLFGEGLDRSTGKMAVEPSRPSDLRNLHLYAGKAQARKGITAKLGPLKTGEATPRTIEKIVAVVPFQADGSAIVVGMIGNEMHVLRVDGLAESYNWIAKWSDNRSGVTPRVIGAEVGGLLFLAHDEKTLAAREHTVYYDMNDGLLKNLTASWAQDGGADNKIRFRGVVAHLGYLWGWGFGTNVTDRPELVRSSLPGQPTVFETRHHAAVGAWNDAVLRCIPVGNVLFVMKRADTYKITGYDRTTFGVHPADTRFGVLGSLLAVEVNGVCYAWTAEGPRASDGGIWTDLALPLDLIGEEPADLQPMGDSDYGFAVYVPERREVVFVFGRRGYSLSIYNPAEPKWGYVEFGFEPSASGILYGLSDAPATRPLGYPEYEVPGDPDADEDTTTTALTATVWWTNTDHEGHETVDLFYRKVGAASWTKLSFRVLFSTMQSKGLSDLLPEQQYDVALRYRNRNLTTEGYDSDDPSTWDSTTYPNTAKSKGTFTTQNLQPSGLTAQWERNSATSELIRLDWTNPAEAAGFPIRIKRINLEGGVEQAGTEKVFNVAADTTSFINGNSGSDGIAGEQMYRYTVLYVRSDNVELTGTQVDRWSGPNEIASMIEATPSGSDAEYGMAKLTWTIETPPASQGSWVIELGHDYRKDNFFEYKRDVDPALGALTQSLFAPAGPSGAVGGGTDVSRSYEIRYRTKQTYTDGVTVDYSYSQKISADCIGSGDANDQFGTGTHTTDWGADTNP